MGMTDVCELKAFVVVGKVEKVLTIDQNSHGLVNSLNRLIDLGNVNKKRGAERLPWC
jgi:hypothetical protein